MSTPGFPSCLAAGLAALAWPAAAAAQTDSVPAVARALVVYVRGHFGPGTPPYGAGIIVGARGGTLYVATAAHLVQQATLARQVWVKFAGGDSAEATIAQQPDTTLDLAVLGISADPGRLSRWVPRSWDRQGDVESLRGGDAVVPVGCPNKRCWQPPATPDRVVYADKVGVVFQSSVVAVGSSGGALFNAWWEVVGLVLSHERARANALRIDDVVRQLERWRIPVGLRRPSLPRRGYRTTVGAVFLASTRSETSATEDDRVPSGRLSLVRQVTPALTWHVTALRLAPENLAVTAGMAGAGLYLKPGRLVIQPFAEVGFGHVEGRFNRGSYLVARGGDTVLVPSFQRVTGDGLGVGGGMNVDVIVLPRTIIELTAGYWRFTRPDSAPELNSLFVGAGLRWGF